jgi:hypothetical protein
MMVFCEFYLYPHFLESFGFQRMKTATKVDLVLSRPG